MSCWIQWLVLTAFYSKAFSTEFFVSVNEEQCPPNAICQNLSFYTGSPELYFLNESTFYFLEGTHILTEMVEISAVGNVIFQGFDAHISCNESIGGFAFFAVENLTINSLSFSHCGAQVSEEMRKKISEYTRTLLTTLIYTYSYHCLLLVNVRNINIDQLTIHYCRGRAVSAVNAFNVDIVELDLKYSNVQNYNSCSSILSCFGGSIFFSFVDDGDCRSGEEEIFYLSIKNSTIAYGVNMAESLFNGGLGISMYYSSNFGIDVVIDSVTLDGNTGINGANLYFSIEQSLAYYSVTLNNITSINGNAIYPFGDTEDAKDSMGAGLYFDAGIFQTYLCAGDRHMAVDNGNTLTITDSTISYNIAGNGGGAWIGMKSCVQGDQCFMIVENTTFSFNSGITGSALYLKQYTSLDPRVQLSGILRNVNVLNNNAAHYSLNYVESFVKCAVYIFEYDNVTLAGLEIRNHPHTGIYLYSSEVTIDEFDIVIENNTNKRGGGMIISGNSLLILKPPANITFIGNHAEMGAAMYIETPIIEDSSPLCFFQVDDVNSFIANVVPVTHIFAMNNLASITGNVLYTNNAGLFNCSFAVLSYYKPYYKRKIQQFLESLLISDVENEMAVTSASIKVCFCNTSGSVNCVPTDTYLDVIPGEVFNISVATIGLNGMITPGVVREVKKNDDTERLYQVIDECFTIANQAAVEQYSMSQLTAADSTVERQNRPIYVHLNFRDCPPGFGLTNDSVCECNEEIKSSNLNVTCSVIDRKISRVGNNWITFDSSQNCTLVYIGCPLDYCDDSRVTFDISEPDAQCALNRVGTLCGQCQEGFSLLLGSNRCERCSNYYIALIVPFAIAGIVLVAFLMVLNLTVATGTINGLIFYANIVKIFESVFFNKRSIPVLTQFISWINLDLGIPTCFYDGLDAYTKTWMQFIFPVYIWCIIIVIILAANRFTKISRLVGGNPVAILATLLLISYTKILRTIILVMQIGTLSCDSGSKRAVWLLDGSIEYFRYEHGILLFFSLAVFVFICVPFTAVHLFVTVIERFIFKYSAFSKLYSITKPYIDAVGGPYKDQYRFWPGFLLFVRFVLALIVPFTSSYDDLLVILTAVVVLLMIGWNLQGVYQKWYNNFLESWFLLNLGLLCIFSFKGQNGFEVIILISLALATFIIIVIFQIVEQIHKINKQKNSEEFVRGRRRQSRKSKLATKIKRIWHFRDHERLSHENAINELINQSVKCRRETLLTDSEF